MAELFENILFALSNMGSCKHKNYSSPYTSPSTQQCRIICLDCGASALYSPFRFVRTGPWEKLVVQTNRSEIIPHVYRSR